MLCLIICTIYKRSEQRRGCESLAKIYIKSPYKDEKCIMLNELCNLKYRCNSGREFFLFNIYFDDVLWHKNLYYDLNMIIKMR